MAKLALAFDILVGKNEADRELNKVGDASEKTGNKLGKLGGVGKAVGFALGGAVVAGVAGMGAALVNGAKDAANMDRILAQTEAVVKSTGGVAGVTAESIDKFAASLEKTTGIEAESIVEGQNLLLTFTNIKNGVGEGNQVFDQATTILADMSTAMGTDASSSAILLGKALNDPIAGVGALSKAGVQLTDAQKEQIKAFVESGDVMSAQKIILGELTTQFGGSAEAFGNTLPGQVAKAKNAFGELSENLGAKLLPVVNNVLTLFVDDIIPGLETFFGAVSGRSEIGEFEGGLNTINDAGVNLHAFFRDNVLPILDQLKTFITDNVVPALKGLARFIVTDVVPAFSDVVGFVRDNVVPILSGLVKFVLDHVVPAVKNLAEIILGSLQDAFKNISEKINENRPQLESLLGAFQSVAAFVLDHVVPLLGPVLKLAFENVVRYVGWGIDVLSGIVDAFTFFKDTASEVIGIVSGVVFGFFEGVLKTAGTVLSALGFDGLGDKLKDAARAVGIFREDANRELSNVNNTVRIGADTSHAKKGIDDLIKYANGQSANLSFRMGQIRSEFGDGPGRGGSTLSKVSSLIAGSGAYVTSTYRSPEDNRRVGGSPTSYHLDRGNPAVDIGGKTGTLDAIFPRIKAAGPWRELLWRTKGHFDHIHVAHDGGTVSSSWGTLPGLRSDERPAILQVGEEVIPKGGKSDGALLAEVAALRADVRGLVRQYTQAQRKVLA